jgi:hypothetical protein
MCLIRSSFFKYLNWFTRSIFLPSHFYSFSSLSLFLLLNTIIFVFSTFTSSFFFLIYFPRLFIISFVSLPLCRNYQVICYAPNFSLPSVPYIYASFCTPSLPGSFLFFSFLSTSSTVISVPSSAVCFFFIFISAFHFSILPSKSTIPILALLFPRSLIPFSFSLSLSLCILCSYFFYLFLFPLPLLLLLLSTSLIALSFPF